MIFQGVQIVQADIGSQLEFKSNIISFQIFQHLLAFSGSEAVGIKAVTQSDDGHLLACLQRIIDALYTVGYIVMRMYEVFRKLI